jgi:hypothetical protein
MNTKQRYQYQSLRGAQLFVRGHVAEAGVLIGTAPLAQLDTAVDRIESAATEQGTCTRDALGERNNQLALERRLRKDHLSPIAKYGRAELAGVPNFKALTPATRNLEGARLVQVARAVGGAARPYLANFVEGHFPADFITQLSAAADAVQRSMDIRARKNQQRVNATEGIAGAISSGRAAVARLDARITRLVAGNAPLLEEWRVATRVRNKPGIVRLSPHGPVAAMPVVLAA